MLKSFIQFWKKDIINKLIVLISLVLLAGSMGFAYLIFNMPGGKTLAGAIQDILPINASPTFDINIYLTPRTVTPSPYTATPSPTIAVRLTETPTPLVQELPSPTFEPTATLQVETPSPAASAPATLPASTPTPGPVAVTESASTPQGGPLSGPACVPNVPHKTARVLDVVDGNTVRALIDGLVYTVRYIGVDLPSNTQFLEAAKQANVKLVYAKDVQLVPDALTKDERGRLLFYVLIDNQFINVEMIQKGLGLAASAPPNTACDALFQEAQKSAMSAGVGQWSLPNPTPKP